MWTDITTPATVSLVSAVPPEDVELYGIVPEWVSLLLRLLFKKGDRRNLDKWRCLAKIMGAVLDCHLGKILSEEAFEEQNWVLWRQRGY